MVSQKVTVQNLAGLHLRPAGLLCKEAMKYHSRITFRFRGQIFNTKSVLSVLGAGVKNGNELEFMCDGDDEQEALNAIIEIVKNGLGE